VRELVARQLDFMLHRALPDNHSFYAHRASAHNPDFDERVRRFADHAHPLSLPFVAREAMGHVIVVEPPTAQSCYAELCAALAEHQVIRSTSPLDGSSTWIEVYPAGVSKASAAAWILGLAPSEPVASVAIGNDYNDLDLLNWADQAFVVANAPAELRARYATVASNDAGGFSEAVRRALG
jgi:hydroxymethylpyrimidine pyrophosphatase-like HAD family hydrolase